MDRLRIRIEKETSQYRDPSSICIDIIDTLPEDKKSRLASWFAKIKRVDKFDWRNLLDVIQCEFEDVQAQQTAHEFVLRMEQGRNQYFAEFFKDFEHRIASCGKEELFTPSAKTRALIDVKLPAVRKYEEWVMAVREVVVELESFAVYRPKGATQIGTKLGPAKTGSAALPDSSQPEKDAEELSVKKVDTSTGNGQMDKKNKGKKRDSEEEKKKKPRAPWRSKDEFDSLYKQGVCTRCTKSGHLGPKCPSFRPARRPKEIINHLEGESSEKGCDSENE
ncbi:hypothetical protein EPUL_001149 [Erysiphe pulchra]|uniref:CCHC-type domain-containing protein n=1 Tax=Erysiphe pulchra TaxID=225359 RepID=A0A2S4PZE8_9PEZI|nr:hypothetical protein EPUL_001149 [Erysiphe pulchra]